MASTLSTFREKVKPRLQDAAAKLDSEALDKAIMGAVAHYQQARPRRLAQLVDGAGVFDYQLDGTTPKLASWVDGISAILEVIYPWDAAAARPPVLDISRYCVLRLSTGLFLRFLDVTPTAAQKFHVLYSSAHVVIEGSSSVPAADEEALADLATAYACDALAGFYSQSTDGSLSADTVAHLTKAQEYRAQAKRWREAYAAKLGGDAADAPASGASAVMSVFGSIGREGYFFHGQR
jgi:hypothetical protein